jgi:hypothetical protein
MPPDELEEPDYLGRQFTVAESQDEWPSRAHGWALVVALIFAIIGFSSLRSGEVMGAGVFFSLAAGVFILAAVTIRREVRNFMRFRHRL